MKKHDSVAERRCGGGAGANATMSSSSMNRKLQRDRQLVLDPATVSAPLAAFSDGEDSIDDDEDDEDDDDDNAILAAGFNKSNANIRQRQKAMDNVAPETLRPETQRLLRRQETEEFEFSDDNDDNEIDHISGGGSIVSEGRRYKALSSSEPLETMKPVTIENDFIGEPEAEGVTSSALERRDVPRSLFAKPRRSAKLYRYASGPEIIVHSVDDGDVNETARRRTMGGSRMRGRHGASYPRFPFTRCDTAPAGDTVGDDYYVGRRKITSGTSTAAASPSLHSTTSYLRDQITALFQVSRLSLKYKLPVRRLGHLAFEN
jgi:hypothetical protein